MPKDLPEYLEGGERARLFPILSEKNKEARALSPFLATMSVVRDFATEILGDIDVKVGARAQVDCYTEVTLKTGRKDKDGSRPDGLIVVNTGRSEWKALVEAKIGDNQLENPQIERYLGLAKQHNCDAVITISNQFSAVPHHHPLVVSGHKTRSVDLFHFSWMHLLTIAELQLMNETISDSEQHWLLNEFVRFIGEDSAGVRGFDQMPKSWRELVGMARSGAPNLPEQAAQDVVEAWQQECRDLELILSRQLGSRVEQKLSRDEKAVPIKKLENDLERLKSDKELHIELAIPDAASTLKTSVFVGQGTIVQSVYVKAPGDRKTNKARLNWLLRQLPDRADTEVSIRSFWPGRSLMTERALADLREDPTWLFDGKDGMQVVGFEIVRCVDLGARMAQPRTIIQQIEQAVPDFYELVVQNLSEWQPSPPKLAENRSKPSDVSPSRLAEE